MEEAGEFQLDMYRDSCAHTILSYSTKSSLTALPLKSFELLDENAKSTCNHEEELYVSEVENSPILEVSDTFQRELPPPKLYYRTIGQVQRWDGRCASCESIPSKEAKGVLYSQQMTRSMPNFRSNRSYYNRSIGSDLDHHALLLLKSRPTVHDRIAEFDEWLESMKSAQPNEAD